MKIFEIESVPMIHISEFSKKAGRSITSIRYIINDESRERKLKYYRDGSRIYIPLSEVYGYPFKKQGATDNPIIYHYIYNKEKDKLEECICESCTFGTPCQLNILSQQSIIPKGDN